VAVGVYSERDPIGQFLVEEMEMKMRDDISGENESYQLTVSLNDTTHASQPELT